MAVWLCLITFLHFVWLQGTYLGHFILPGHYTMIILGLTWSHFSSKAYWPWYGKRYIYQQNATGLLLLGAWSVFIPLYLILHLIALGGR